MLNVSIRPVKDQVASPFAAEVQHIAVQPVHPRRDVIVRRQHMARPLAAGLGVAQVDAVVAGEGPHQAEEGLGVEEIQHRVGGVAMAAS